MANAHSSPPLKWDVFVSPGLPLSPPNQTAIWSQTAFTLIQGTTSAILVDAPITTSRSNDLADWILKTAPGQKLTHIYITHGHGDHFFGAAILAKRFPGVKVVATKGVVDHAKEQLEPANFALWESFFPGKIPTQDVDSWTVLKKHETLELDGHRVVPVELGQSDTYATTVLHVPSIGLVVCGDAVYGSYFQYMVESKTAELRQQWKESVNKISKLENVKHIVPSHTQESDGFGLVHLETTKKFIDVWGKEVEEAKSAKDLVNRMHKAFPERKGDFILGWSASTAFPE